MKYFLSIILSFSYIVLYDQTGYTKIETITDEKIEVHGTLEFPLILSNNKYVNEKINTHLQLSELELLKGKEQKSIFEATTINNGTIYGGKVSITYHILTNSKKNLAIKFDESSSGMTMAYWARYYNFNPQNGDRYSLIDFFSEKDFPVFQNYVLSVRQKDLKKQGASELLDMYLSENLIEDDLEDFYFTEDSIFFDYFNLLHKNDKFSDLNETGIAIKDIKHLLNEFGKAVLITGENLDKFRSVTEPQLYEGVIGNNGNFYLLFRERSANELQGIYAYKRYGKGINLEGKLVDKEYSFEEKDENFETTATLIFEKQKETLTGHWQGNDKRILKLKATRK